ncbi:MAG: hypothetical protein ISS77_06475 [Phycisphaerae bacterium]|nr:hypothetical protein [Phycisphaerae bacterium]
MVIGIRSFVDGFAYVILDGTQSEPEILSTDRISLPENHSWPACLAWIRKQIAEILQKYDIEAACIKAIESMAKKKSSERYQIEAVLQEYIYFAKSINCNTRIKSQLKRDILGFNDSARYLDRVLKKNRALANLNSPQYQEATLAAISELPGKK